MKRYHYFAVGIALLCILGASILLVPGQRELALMHLKDKDYETARRLYATQSVSDDLSASVVVPLTDLYLQNADVQSAVTLMERFVHRHPDNLSGLRRLGQLYRYAQRPEDSLANLEQIARLQPTEDELRELSNIYNFTSQYGKQIDILKRLVKIQPGNPQNLIDLAYLQASQELIADAARTMENFESQHPKAASDDTVEFRLSLLLDSGEPGRAFNHASAWISKHRGPEIATRFASLLHFKKQPALALRLIEPLEDMISKSPALLAQLIELQITLGQHEKAYARLRTLNDSGKMPDDVSPAFIDLCLTRREFPTAIAVARRGPLDRLPEWLVINLGDMAISAKRGDFARHMLGALSDSFCRNYPVLAARLAFSLQDISATERWIRVAERHPELPADQIIGLAGLYVALGRRGNALGQLLRISDRRETPNWVLHDLARLYVETGGASKGLPLFERLRKSRRSIDIDADWALMTASAGNANAVTTWLRDKDTRDVDPQILTDLYYIGEETGAPELAVAAAESLYRRRGGRSERFMLGKALIAAGRSSDALPHLRPLLPGSNEEESAYVNALTAVAEHPAFKNELCDFLSRKLNDAATTQEGREDLVRALLELHDYRRALPAAADLAKRLGGSWFSLYVESADKAGERQTLVAFLEAELDRRDLSGAAKEERLQVLLDHGGNGEALPYLRSLAAKSGGEWSVVYEETLLKMGRRGELYAAWTKRLSRPETSPSEKREIAYRALEAGQKGMAEAIFRTLAGNASANSPDVSQLLYLWGPRPSAPALDWIEARALASSGEELPRWMQHLMNAGSAKRAAAAARNRLPPAGKGGPVLEAYLAALSASGEKAELNGILEREISADMEIQHLRGYSRFALDRDLALAAQKALLKILLLAPDDREALRQLGCLAFSKSNYTLAKSYLSRYLASGSGDYESNFCFGELMSREGRHGLARSYFHRSLQQIGSKEPSRIAARVLQAKLLLRLNRSKEAVAACEKLIADQPGDKHLRADLVAAMLDAGLPEDARRYLKTQIPGGALPLAANHGAQTK